MSMHPRKFCDAFRKVTSNIMTMSSIITGRDFAANSCNKADRQKLEHVCSRPPPTPIARKLECQQAQLTVSTSFKKSSAERSPRFTSNTAYFELLRFAPRFSQPAHNALRRRLEGWAKFGDHVIFLGEAPASACETSNPGSPRHVNAVPHLCLHN